MDWILKSKFTKWLISFLIICNITLIIMIWILINKPGEPRVIHKPSLRDHSLVLLKKDLNLSKDQQIQFDKLRRENFRQIKVFLDSIRISKQIIAKELENDIPDLRVVSLYTIKIGQFQGKIEEHRFLHFQKLLDICSPEQKIKLKKMLSSIISNELPPPPPPAAPGPPPVNSSDNSVPPPPPK